MSARVKDEKGIALVIVLTVVALLTITVMEFAYNVQLDHRRTRNSVDAMQARLLARSGLNLAEAFLIQDQEDKFDAFTEDWALALDEFCDGIQLEPTMRLRCGWEDESGKINVNMMRPKGPPLRDLPPGTPARPDQVIRDAIVSILRKEGFSVEKMDEIELAIKEYWEADYLNQSNDEKEKFAPDIGSLEDFATYFKIPPGKLKNLRRSLTAKSNRLINRVNVNTAPERVLTALFVGDYNNIGGEEPLSQILAERQEAAYEDMSQVKAIVGAMDASVRAALENGVLGVTSRCFRLQASGLTNVDPTEGLESELGESIDAEALGVRPPVPSGIGQTLSELVCRKPQLNPNQGGGRSGSQSQNQNQNQNKQLVWTLKRLDWQKEAGARLFREPVHDPLNSEETDEDGTGLTGEEDDEF